MPDTNDNHPLELSRAIVRGECGSDLSVGLLGAKLSVDRFNTVGPKAINEVRLEEIERRILNIEEQIRVIAAVVQP